MKPAFATLTHAASAEEDPSLAPGDLAALNERSMPTVEPHFASLAIDRQHAGDLAAVGEVKRVVATEGVRLPAA